MRGVPCVRQQFLASLYVQRVGPMRRRCAQVVTVVGTSMGAAVIWSYLELFGDARIAKAVFVDQAPLQVCADAPREIGFDTCCISYVKTAFLTRMLSAEFS